MVLLSFKTQLQNILEFYCDYWLQLNNSDSLLFGINNLIIPQWYYSVTKSYLIYTMYNSGNVIYLTFNKFVKCEEYNNLQTCL